MFRLLELARKHCRGKREKKNCKDEEKGSAQFNDTPTNNKKENMGVHEEKIKNLGKLFVGGLSQSTTEKELEAYFSQFGSVVDSVVPRFQDSGKSRGFGFVTFINPEDAKAALQIGVHILDGKIIELRSFSTKPPNKNLETRVFLGGLPYSITEETLKQFFSKYGEVVEVVIPRDKNTNQKKGYGFLSFVDQQAAEKCKADQFVFIGGKRVHVEKVEPRDRDQSKNSDSLGCGSVSSLSEALEVLNDEEEGEDKDDDATHVLYGKLNETQSSSSESLNEKLECRIFLGGLPHGITEETLRQFFSRYGEVVEVVIPRDKITKQDKGFGFVKFADRYAAKKCEAHKFVFLGGRRIQIKKAEPRNRCKSSDSLTSDNVSETNIFEALEDEDEDDEEAQSEVSGNEYQTIEQNLALKALLEKYYLEKLVDFDTMNEKNLKNENETGHLQDFNFKELEKLLSGVLSISNNNPSASVSDLMKFSSESEDETESDDDEIDDSFPSDLSKAPIPNYRGDSSNQKPQPLQIRSSEGFLMCSVCQWISPNDSMESFLAHCKTSLHKTKLKDRFPSGQTDNQLQKIDSKPKLVSEKPSANSSVKAKRKNRNKNIKKDVKGQQPSAVTAENKKSNEKTNVLQKAGSSGSLKIHALAKGMASIQPLSKDELMCKLCNKKIPKASEFDVLMKNVSFHLHSKTHLKKLEETENSLMGHREATPTLTSKEKENQKQNNPNVMKDKKCHEGNEKNKATTEKNKTAAEKNKASAVGKSQNVPKVNNNPPKKKQTKNPDSDLKFLCLPCNVRCDSIEVFNVHVKLTSHSDNLANKNVKADVSMANMGKCKGCKLYLCGSLYQINKHYSKCVEK